MKQKTRLRRAEKELGLGPVAVSRLMGVKYDTYKSWKNDRHQMPEVAKRCLDLILHCHSNGTLGQIT